jgi:acetoin utilization protein AcuC
LNGYDIPDDLPAAAQRVLGALSWEGPLRKHDPQDHWITQLRDAPRGGAIRSDLRADVHSLATRHAAEV